MINMRLFAVLLLLLFNVPAMGADGSRAAQNESSLAVHFMSKEEARRVLSEGEALQYYQSLYLNEMRAKTGLPLEGVTLVQAREISRKFYAGETLDFTNEEDAAIQYVLQKLYPGLKTRAPAYVDTPWCFIKVSVRIEGGLPHTRGDCIVLSSSVLDAFAQLASQKRSGELYAAAANLLVHEQTHVLQRRHPDRFASLYVKSLGFRHMAPAPVNDWMREVGVVNPDAPDTGWAYPVPDSAGPRWIMPYLVMKPSARPVMPKDFMTIGITVRENDNNWELVNASPSSVRPLVMDFFTYVRQFPNPGQAYHPNELSADILATWLSEIGHLDLRHPVSEATLTWAKTGLK